MSTRNCTRVLPVRISIPSSRTINPQLLDCPAGRALFERDRNLGTLDEGLNDEDAVSVDISQYDRTAIEEEDDDGDRVTFSDSE